MRTVPAAVALLVALAMLPAPPVQALPRLKLAAQAGGSFLLQPASITDRWNTGFTVSGGLRFKPVPIVSVGIDVGYHRQPFDREAFEATIADRYPSVTVSGGDLWMLPVTAVGEVDLVRWGATKPFVRAGAGLVVVGTQNFSASGPGSPQVIAEFTAFAPDETVFGTLLGLGVRTPLGPGLDLSLDVGWHTAATAGEATSFLPVRIGLVF